MNGALYERDAERFLDTVAPLPDDLPIRATPDWTLLQLIAHLTGGAADLAELNLEAAAEPGRTGTQVAQRAGRSRDELAAEWRGHVPRVAQILNDPGAVALSDVFARRALLDITCHEADVRESAELPLVVDDDDWVVVGAHRQWVLDNDVTAAGLAALSISTPEGDAWTVGSGDATARLVVSRYELWRSLMGRRTRAEVRGYEWSVDPDPYIAVWVSGNFDWPE